MDSAAILRDLEDHGFADTSTERKVAVLNETYWDICGLEPWPFLEKAVDLTFSGSSGVPTNLPADFQAARNLRISSTTNKLRHMRQEEFEESFGAALTTTGLPYIYYFQGQQLRVWPIPSVSTLVTVNYLQMPPALTETSAEVDIVIPKEFHRGLLVNGALYKLYAMEDDMELAFGFQQFFDRTLNRMRENVWRKQWDRPDYIRPVDTDDADYYIS